jgi:hypothetical protein
MNDILDTARDRDTGLENLAAELTHAVHLLVLQRGRKDSWLDLELGLWSVVTEAVNKWGRESPHGSEAFVCDCVGGPSEAPQGDGVTEAVTGVMPGGPFLGE